MDWKSMRRSSNVQDARGARRGVPLTLGGVVVVMVASYFLGINPQQLLGTLEGGGGTVSDGPPVNDADSDFVRAILGDTEDVWGEVMPRTLGRPYPQPQLVLFSGGVQSECGGASTQTGPFYCPVDRRVYLDMGFFKYLAATAEARADFARAYAIAHEVGHYVQDVLGTLEQVQRQKQSVSKAEANALQVKVELQADCFAGVWGHATKKRALAGEEDLQGALEAAAQIGDDYIRTAIRFLSGDKRDRLE
jgi:predicted metalloprotease